MSGRTATVLTVCSFWPSNDTPARTLKCPYKVRMAWTLLRENAKRVLDGVGRGRPADRDPAQLAEFLESRAAPKASPTAGLDPAEGHLWLVVHRRAVDVAHSRKYLRRW